MTIEKQQHLLAYLDYYTGPCNGVATSDFKSATVKFQSDYRLDPDGIFGPLTEKMAIGVISGSVAKKEQTMDVQNGDSDDYWPRIHHFTPDEEYITCPCYRCKDKKLYPMECLMLEADRIRDIAKRPMIPSSVRRCQAHNDELDGSVPNSYHIDGYAMDFDIPALPDAEIAKILDGEKAAGRVRYWYQMKSGYFHFDVEKR